MNRAQQVGMNLSTSAESVIPIQFSSLVGHWGASGAPVNGFSLAGTGSIALGGGSITISGTIERTFQATRAVTLIRPLGSVSNVARIENRVQLDLTTEEGKEVHLVFWTQDAEAAQELLSRLPATQTEAFAQALGERREFLERLERVGGPWVTRGLVVLNVCAFLVLALLGGGLFTASPEVLVRYGTNYGPLTLDGEWWRLFTAMFIHFGLLHLLFNMYALWQMGAAVERFFGSAHYLLLYLASGLAGGFASLWWHPVVNSAGASGAIFGVIGGLLAFVVRKNNGVPLSILKAYRQSALLFTGFNLLYGFASTGIDNAAHLGGLGTGFLVGLALARPLDKQPRSRSGLQRLALGGVAALLILGLMWAATTRSSAAALREVSVEREILRIVEADKALVALFQENAARAKEGKADDRALADEVEKRLLPVWVELSQQVVEPVPSAPASRRGELHAAYAHYVDATRRSLEVLVVAARQGGPEKLTEMNAAFSDRQKWAREIQRLNKAGG